MCINKSEIVGWLIRTAHMHKNLVESRLYASKVGIHPAQHRILMQLAINPGINQKQLAKNLDISPATVTTSIKKIIKMGYAVRENQKDDNRNNLLTITDSGSEVIKKSVNVFEDIDSRMFNGFGDEELIQLKSYLCRIYVNLDK